MDITTLALAKKYAEKLIRGEGAIQGKPGLSAYEIAVEKGFEGTEEQWLESLKVVETIVNVSSAPQAEMYNINQAIKDSIAEVLKTPDAKDGTLISMMQPFNNGDNVLIGSGYILNHGDNIWSGSMVFSVPTAITAINMVGTYDFQYLANTNQLAIDKTINEDDLRVYAVAAQQDPQEAGKGLVIDENGKVTTGTIKAEVSISDKVEDNVLKKAIDGGLYVSKGDCGATDEQIALWNTVSEKIKSEKTETIGIIEDPTIINPYEKPEGGIPLNDLDNEVKNKINKTYYEKPSSGIPENDLATALKTKINSNEIIVQSWSDMPVTSIVSHYSGGTMILLGNKIHNLTMAFNVRNTVDGNGAVILTSPIKPQLPVVYGMLFTWDGSLYRPSSASFSIDGSNGNICVYNITDTNKEYMLTTMFM